MVFNSLQYALLFPAVLVVYWRLKRQGQNRVLLVASYLFYAAFDWRFLILMVISTVVDFVVGRELGQRSSPSARRWILLSSLAVNLGILGVFKCFDFFVRSLDAMLDRLGLQWSQPVLQVLLPVGISFYTFHGISYTVDVYRGHVKPATNLVDFAVFVAYFPQLVAGPIGRAHIQLPQFENDR